MADSGGAEGATVRPSQLAPITPYDWFALACAPYSVLRRCPRVAFQMDRSRQVLQRSPQDLKVTHGLFTDFWTAWDCRFAHKRAWTLVQRTLWAGAIAHPRVI